MNKVLFEDKYYTEIRFKQIALICNCSYACLIDSLFSYLVAEVIFGDVAYTVNEGVGVVTVKVVRRGYLNNIVSVGKTNIN